MEGDSQVVPFRALERLFQAVVTSFAIVAMISAVPSFSTAQMVKMHGTVAPGVSTTAIAGHLNPAKMLNLDIRFALRNRALLDQLIAGQIDPSSPHYHQWLTPSEFTRRFGPTNTDFSSVKKWLAANGFQTIGGSREEGYLRFSADASSAERVFNTKLVDFGNGDFANVTELEIPAQLADVIGDIVGMQNLGRLEPVYKAPKLKQEGPNHLASKHDAHWRSASGAALSLFGGEIFTFAAPDFYSFYDESPLLNAGNTGANGTDCIGIFAATNIFPEPAQATILSDYFSAFSQYTSFSTNPVLTIDLSKEKDPGVINQAYRHGGDLDFEAYLDIEAAHIVAPGAPITLYVTNPSLSLLQNLSDALTAMTTENKCSALNFSYYLCGESTSFLTTTLGDLFSKAQADGQSIFVASADHGVDTCLKGSPNVNELAANPLTTSVGGTQSVPTYDQNGFATGYSPESSWNDQNLDTSKAGVNTVSGGGASAVFNKPVWQKGVAGTSNDNARDLPDVASLAGSPHIFIHADRHDANAKAVPQDTSYLTGGTSLASPLWAGFTMLLQTANGGKRLGSLNPVIWELGIAGQEANGFHDIVSGNNDFISDSGGKTVPGYSAGPGYDLVTGWGSIDANSFITAYLNAPIPAPTVSSKLSATPAILKFAPTAVGFASKVKKLTLVNRGRRGSPPVTLSGFTMTLNLSSSGGTCFAGEMLAAMAKCTIGFVMMPSTAGTNSGSVNIKSDTIEGDLSIDASVTGKMPK